MTTAKPDFSRMFVAALDRIAESAERLIIHNVDIIGRRRTSFRFDNTTWFALHDIARRDGARQRRVCAKAR